MYAETRYLTVGDHGISVEFGNDVDAETNLLVQKLRFALEKATLEGVIETIPTLRSLFVCYDPRKIKLEDLVFKIKAMEKKMTDVPLPQSRLFEIPVAYGGEHGPDFDTVAKFLSLSPEELIGLHSGKEYVIFQTGFIGGSAHFKISPPLDSLVRKKTPNLGVPAGSVLIAGGLGCAFKPLAGPTGWYWIGTSPLRQWFPDKDPPLLINPGDRIIYKAVGADEFAEIKKRVELDRYDPQIVEKDACNGI